MYVRATLAIGEVDGGTATERVAAVEDEHVVALLLEFRCELCNGGDAQRGVAAGKRPLNAACVHDGESGGDDLSHGLLGIVLTDGGGRACR